MDAPALTVQVFASFEEAEAADIEARRALTPEQRIEIFFAIRERAHPDAAQQGLARVYRMFVREPG